jgi:PAS domain S-box-containing protein
MRINNLRFRSKLILGFVIVISLSLIISIFSLFQLNKLHKNTNLIYKHPFAVSNSVLEIKIGIYGMHKAMKDIVYSESKAEIDSAMHMAKGYNKQVSKAFEVVFDRFLGDVSDVEKAYDCFKDSEHIRKEVISLKLEGKEIEARHFLNVNGAKHIQDLLLKTGVMENFAKNKADEFRADSERTYYNTLTLLLISLATILIFSILIAFVISKSILTPIYKFISYIEILYKAEDVTIASASYVTEEDLFSITISELKSAYRQIEDANHELSVLNEDLDEKVKFRTAELEKNELKLKDKNEEYLAINEELNQTIEELQEAKLKVEETQSRLQIFLESSPIGYAIFDTEYKYIMLNDAMVKLNGPSRKEHIGKSITEILGKDGKLVQPIFERIMETKEPVLNIEISGEVPAKPGLKSHFMASYFPIFNTHNVIIGIGASVLDISENKNAQGALKASEERYRQMFENNLSIKLLIDSMTGYIVDANNAALKFYGYNRKDITSMQISDINILSEEEVSLKLEQAKNSNKLHFNFRHKLASGEIRDVEVYSGPIGGKDQNLLYSIIHDVTERKKTENALKEREEHLRTVYEAAQNVAFVRTDIGGENTRIIDFSPGAEKIFGYKAEEVIGKKVAILHPESEVRNFPIMQDDLRSGRSEHSGEEILMHKSGAPFSALMTINPIHDKNGNLIGTLGVSIDISDRKRAENVNKIQSGILANMSEAVFLIRKNDGIILYTNEEFEKLFGYSNNELLGKHASIVNASMDKKPEEIAKEIMEIIEETGYWEGEIKNIKKDKIEFWSYARVSVFDHPQFGEVLISVHRDISKRIQAEKELRKAKEKAEESDRLKSAFLANMSHEIRTPMNGIIGFAKLLKKPNIPAEKLDRFIDIIVTSSNQLLSIVNDILDISKIETGQIDVVSEDVNINEILDETLKFFKLKASNNNVKLECTTDISSGFSIVTDGVKLKQILMNLVDNAIKFSRDGKVEFGYETKEKQILFYVRDTGMGISKNQHNKVFQRFSKIEHSKKEIYGGNGLGLSICKGFSEALGGRIWFESGENKGTNFYFTIINNKKE